MRGLAQPFLNLLLLLFFFGLIAVFFGEFERTFYYYNQHPIHKATALALLQGQLHFSFDVRYGFDYDVQVYNGAAYTNWGYGVPLLQLPFHALSFLYYWLSTGANPYTATAKPFFPDLLIFTCYASLVLTFCTTTLVKALQYSKSAVPWLSWLLALLTMAIIAIQILSFQQVDRFIVYEETIAYFGLCQIAAAGFLLRWLISLRPTASNWLNCTSPSFFGFVGLASFAILVRPTGLVYWIAWAGAVTAPLIFQKLESASVKRAFRFLAFYLLVSLPLLALWLYTNWVKSGSLLSAGYQNTTPGDPQQIINVRFGIEGRHQWSNIELIAKYAFAYYFGGPSFLPGNNAASFLNIPTEELVIVRMPLISYFESAVLIIILLLPLIKRWASRNSNASTAIVKLDLCAAAFSAASVLGVFLLMTLVSFGFTARYAGDFLPAIYCGLLLTIAEWPPRNLWIGFCFLLLSLIDTTRSVCNDFWPRRGQAAAVLDLEQTQQFGTTLTKWNLPADQAPDQYHSRVECNASHSIYHPLNGYGWHNDCSVEQAINFVVALPIKSGQSGWTTFKLTVSGEKLPRTAQFFLNGKVAPLVKHKHQLIGKTSIDLNQLRANLVVFALKLPTEFNREQTKVQRIELAPYPTH